MSVRVRARVSERIRVHGRVCEGRGVRVSVRARARVCERIRVHGRVCEGRGVRVSVRVRARVSERIRVHDLRSARVRVCEGGKGCACECVLVRLSTGARPVRTRVLCLVACVVGSSLRQCACMRV